MTTPTKIRWQAHLYSNIKWTTSPIGYDGDSTEMILHWSAQKWHWRIHLFCMEQAWRQVAFYLTAGWMLIASKKLQLVTSLERVPRNHRYVPRHPTRWMASVLTNRPWPIRQNGLAERYHTSVTPLLYAVQICNQYIAISKVWTIL